ncbi:hypothetical protein HNQ93_004209 [Hymenobacter luteus]|uniref:Uncharacterized protein n=2 Tax=Hymenobacter TaxID=89966 RepID=A0A7W9T4D9_9BACT|nr:MULTISPECIES: hypothetical protein [Hymenobacter]MBB4603497.1 hypothetical protein [Hymenobacter latericoloratus]MBB6061330.1 hypothetical protein [Hymenobacter luteus]
MPVPSNIPPAFAASCYAQLVALRAELRCILQHPAIEPGRRQAAEAFMDRCTDAARLERWLALAVVECGRWEEQTLASEGRQER